MSKTRNFTVFNYKDYKEYLADVITTAPRKGHGMRSHLAQAIGCHSGYVSQVLSGPAHFSLEQADAINGFLGHKKDEAKFFLLLVQYERAGTHSLKEHFLEEMRLASDKHLNLKHRLDVKNALSLENQARYYQDWYHAAIHMLVTIPQFQTIDALSRRLDLPRTTVAHILRFLISLGLVIEENGRFKGGTVRMHLPSDSPFVRKHHGNWRLRAMHALDKNIEHHLHYSSVVTIAGEDVLKLKSLFVDAIQNAKTVIRDSKEEKAYCFNLDFFEI